MSAVFATYYTLQPDCDQARRRHRAYWQGAATDPLLIIKAKNNAAYPLLSVDAGKNRRELDDDVSWHINYCRSQYLGEDHLFDSMPLARVMFGRDLTCMGVLANCQFAIEPQTEFITFAADSDFLYRPTPDFTPDHPFVRQALAIYAGVCDATGRQACVNPPTSADALTTLSMIMGTENFLLSLCREPELITTKALALNRLFYGFYAYIYQFLLRRGYGEAASWFPVFAEGKFDSVRSDVAVMLSPDMFARICLPVLADACSYLDYAMFNLDSVNLIRFLPYLKRIPRLQGIYWNLEPWLDNIGDYLPVLRQICESGLRLALPCRDVGQAKLALNALRKNNLLLEFPVFATKALALAAGEELRAFITGSRY